jgi:hypothetical protein
MRDPPELHQTPIHTMAYLQLSGFVRLGNERLVINIQKFEKEKKE